MPLDPVKEASLRFIAGSHRWDKPVRPVTWSDDCDFYEGAHDWTDVPDPAADPEELEVLEWAMQPGDVVLFNFRNVHGTRGNLSDRASRTIATLDWR